MQIKILGTRGNIKKSRPGYRKHSGILIDDCLLLDCGEEEFLKHNLQFIFITHFHPDHAFFIKEQTKISVPLYGPETSQKTPKVTALSEKIKVDHYRITPCPTTHSLKVKSQAYLIEKEKQKILYTGDIISFKNNPRLPKLDLVITEASFWRKGGLVRKDKKTGEIYGHAGVPDLIKLFKPYTQKILLVHFGSWFVKDPKKGEKKIKKLGKEQKITLLAGHDGVIFTLTT